MSSSGPMLKAFQASLPSAMPYAAIQPRTPNSPPETPTMYLSFTTSPAMVIVSPLAGSAFLIFQTSLPVLASSAMTWPSSVTKRILPSA